MPTILALHGFTGRGSSWDRVRALLLAKDEVGEFDVIAPDLPGHGPSRGPTSADVPDSWQGCLKRLVPAEPVHLLGYSLGARLALGLLVEHPEKVLSATLIGVRPGLAGEERARRAAQDDELARELEENGLEAFVDRWQRLPLFASQAGLDPEVLAEQRRVRLSHDPLALARALRVLSPGRMPDYRPRLAQIARPVRLMAGELDLPFREMAQVEIVPDAGHNLPLEAPDAVAQAVARTALRPLKPA